jgi:hypothetical protein
MAQEKKGAFLEEVIRNYFRSLDYFVIRSIPVSYKNFPITDIDIWAYKKSSAISKQITIIDVKNKKTPQALERIFWLYGLKAVINADKAIIVTNERKKEIIDFGKKLDILVFDGAFVDRLKDHHFPSLARFTEEGFFEEIKRASFGKIDGDWQGRLKKSKEKLAQGLSFDACNFLLEQAHFFTNIICINDSRKETAMRCFCLLCSYIAICADYILRDILFVEQKDRKHALADGFAYGDRGESGTKKVINLSINMVKQYAENGESTARKIQCEMDKEMDNLHANILADYFSNSEIIKSLFQIALDFEQIAMGKKPLALDSTNLVKSMIGCLLDFWQIERKTFFDTLR